MITKKNELIPPYIGIETIDGIPVFYNRKGDFSVIIKCQNPVIQYCADKDSYYDFHNLFINVLKILGTGYTLQKQDILAKNTFSSPTQSSDYLDKRYFDHFDGRVYTDVTTYLVITKQLDKSKFFAYDKRIFETFIRNVGKVLDLFGNKSLKARLLSENEIENYIKRVFSFNFNKRVISLENLKVKDENVSIGKKTVQSISLVDIDEVDFPSTIKPYKEINIGLNFPVDLLSFFYATPNVETILYNQVISIPDQRTESNKLESKKKRHSGMPDPANDLCVEDIERVQKDIARDGQFLVYAHYNVMIGGYEDLSKASNFVETSLFDSSITTSKQCHNQLELLEGALPGNAVNLKAYDKFLTTSDAATCLLFKERLQTTEESPFTTYFCDRQGLPIGIDISGKEGDIKYTNNSNFFVLGPSGSGKSFYVNSIVRQWLEQNTDIVIVDTGHSYSGICEYKKGKYITYTEENPITMNPFKIIKKEYNREKIEFLKNLIFLIWKGSNYVTVRTEERIIQILIKEYYSNYFSESEVLFTPNEREEMISERLEDWRNEPVNEREEKTEQEVLKKIKQFIKEQEDDFKKEKTRERIVTSLSFNSFFDFAATRIPEIVETKKISFDIDDFKFILEAFYRGGEFEKTLNNDIDNSLFEEQFIVFEIDAIKDDPTLFPIVTLIIMDVFIQKMRLKKNRKALIIEEAWKAIASPMMASYILYLYKTVRKFWGMAMVVTQELDDIISNPVVKNSIINNSDIICLLDQTKFKDNFTDIANLLSLSEVEQKKIFTINQLQNKENRNRFNEVYIKRGSFGSVYGVEVSLHEYFTFTTERIEKDTVSYYQAIYEDFQIALDNFILDLKSSKLKPGEWVRQVSAVLGHYSENGKLSKLFDYEMVSRDSLCEFIKKRYKELTKK